MKLKIKNFKIIYIEINIYLSKILKMNKKVKNIVEIMALGATVHPWMWDVTHSLLALTPCLQCPVPTLTLSSSPLPSLSLNKTSPGESQGSEQQSSLSSGHTSNSLNSLLAPLNPTDNNQPIRGLEI